MNNIQHAPENRQKAVCPLRGASILTVIVHSAVWSLDDMGMYLSV
jgi:hypothetical protein